MSTAGAQAVVVVLALPCWVCRPRAWASIGLIWAISSCALRRSWNGSHRIMVVIWSPLLWAMRPGGSGRKQTVSDQRSPAELNYVQFSLNTVHLSRSSFKKADGAVGPGPHNMRAQRPPPDRCGNLVAMGQPTHRRPEVPPP